LSDIGNPSTEQLCWVVDLEGESQWSEPNPWQNPGDCPFIGGAGGVVVMRVRVRIGWVWVGYGSEWVRIVSAATRCGGRVANDDPRSS